MATPTTTADTATPAAQPAAPVKATRGLDIDALLGESAPRPLIYKGVTFDCPAELPGGVLLPFLDPEVGLIDEVIAAVTNADEDDEWTDMLIGSLVRRPRLPLELLEAAKQALEALLDDEVAGQYDRFMALKPSVNAWVAITRELLRTYGVSITDFFGSDDSSSSGPESSRETSGSTPASTFETPSDPAPAPEVPVAAPTPAPVAAPAPIPAPMPTPVNQVPEGVFSD